MQGIYSDGRYIGHNPGWHEEDSVWKADHVARLLERNRVKPASLCEVGCGAGEILNQLAGVLDPAARVVGYEVSPQAHEIARRKARPNLEFILGDALAPEGERFDVAMAIDVFEHVEDYMGFLRRLRARGRHYVFHIPLDLTVLRVIRKAGLLAARRKVGHLHYFNQDTAFATLADTGYRVVDWFYTCGAIELPKNRDWRARVMRLPRRVLFALDQDFAARLLGGFSLMVLCE